MPEPLELEMEPPFLSDIGTGHRRTHDSRRTKNQALEPFFFTFFGLSVLVLLAPGPWTTGSVDRNGRGPHSRVAGGAPVVGGESNGTWEGGASDGSGERDMGGSGSLHIEVCFV